MNHHYALAKPEKASERASLRSEDKNRPSKATPRPRVVLTLAAVQTIEAWKTWWGSGSSTFSVVLAQYPLLRRRNLSTYFERYYRNV